MQGAPLVKVRSRAFAPRCCSYSCSPCVMTAVPPRCSPADPVPAGLVALDPQLASAARRWVHVPPRRARSRSPACHRRCARAAERRELRASPSLTSLGGCPRWGGGTWRRSCPEPPAHGSGHGAARRDEPGMDRQLVCMLQQHAPNAGVDAQAGRGRGATKGRAHRRARPAIAQPRPQSEGPAAG